jgi:hypothetical protein
MTSGDTAYALLIGRACDVHDAWKGPAGLARDRTACNVRAAYPQLTWDEASAYVREHPEIVPDPDIRTRTCAQSSTTGGRGRLRSGTPTTGSSSCSWTTTASTTSA